MKTHNPKKKNLLIISKYRIKALNFLREKYLGCFILEDIYNVIHINKLEDLDENLYGDIRSIWMDCGENILYSNKIYDTINYHKNIELSRINKRI